MTRRSSGVPQGASVRSRLVALVLIPVLGMSIFTITQVLGRLKSASTAGDGRSLVEDAVAIDRVRVAYEQEILPTQGVAVLKDKATRVKLGIDNVPFNLESFRREASRLQGVTNDALAKALKRPTLATDLKDTQKAIEAGRRSLQTSTQAGRSSSKYGARFDGTSRALDGAKKVSVALGTLEMDKVVKATRLGLDGNTTSALRDLELVMRAARSASTHTGQYVNVTLSATQAELAWPKYNLRKDWATYLSASDLIEATASSQIAAEWKKARATGDVAAVDRSISATVQSTDILPKGGRDKLALIHMTTVVAHDAGRNKALSDVLQFATNRAKASAGAMEAHSRRMLWSILAFSLGLDFILFVALFHINRSITRPLSRLADQAERLSVGELTHVTVDGPREVRTVARGLDAAVGSLQRIQDTAKAVVDGDLASPALQQPLPGRLGDVIHTSMGRIVDAIHAQEEAQKELAHRAAHDTLTELPNRAQALLIVEQALNRGARTGSTTALMFIDLDKFKQVNDTLGHQAGDIVLQIAAERMRSVVRDGDTVARLGGDEFVVIMEGIGQDANFIQLAERLVASMSEPMEVMGHFVSIGASVGVALSSDGQTDASVLLKEADAAVYEAKRSGRGRVDVFDDHLRRALSDRADLEDAMSMALVNEEFELFYQPVVDLRTGRMLSVEALIRWNRPGYGLVPPNDFIPTAELTSLVDDIGRWTLRRATQQLRDWQAEPRLKDLTVAVNISGRHLSSPELVGDVLAAVQDTGISPAQLILEITETFLLDNPRALDNMAQLRGLGVKFALDDFGTGFTSIAQLARLPIDILKIDRSFTASQDPSHQSLVELMVTAAHTFGLQVVAEGVETAEQVQELTRALADTGQGYYFARPASADQLLMGPSHPGTGQA